MNTLNDFYLKLGEIVFNYQLLENDLRKIYACIRKGSIEDNLEYARLNFKGLGQVIISLRELDNSDNKPYFSNEDYELLLELTHKRNFYCHKVSMKFIYINNFIESKKFSDTFNELLSDTLRIRSIAEQAEKIRIEVFNLYRR